MRTRRENPNPVPRAGGGEEGTVLIVVAGVLAALALMGVAFVITVSSRDSQTTHFLRLEQARQAALSGLEYAMAATKYVCSNSSPLIEGIEAATVREAVEEVNKRFFDTPSANGLYYLKDRDDFPHDAFDVTPDSRALLGDYQNVDQTVEGELDPVGALYTMEIVSRFHPDGLTEPPVPPGGSARLRGESHARIRLFGWGRVFDRVGESDFAPVCGEGCAAVLRLKLTGAVSIPDPTQPGHKVYDFEVEVQAIEEMKRMGLSSSDWPSSWTGKTWFMP